MNLDTPYQRYLDQRHFGSLDGLRCISIVAVIWAHGPGEVAKWYVLRSGRLGVELFFAISGFLITTLLLRERRFTGGISLRSFYTRRALRIFPLYYAVLAIYIAMVFALSRHTSEGAEFFHNLRYFLTYTTNWFVSVSAIFSFGWSLATEEQFYCVWPWVEKYCGRFSWLLMAATVLTVLAFRLWIPIGGFPEKVESSIALPICLGVLLAHLLHHRRGYGLAYRCFGWRLAPLMALAASVLAINAHSNKLVLALAFTSVVATCVVREDHWLKPLLASRPFVQIGVISYGMYLMHGLAYNLIEVVATRAGLARHGIPVFLIALAATFLAASASYRYYEVIFLRLKPRAYSGKQVELAPPTAACV